MTKPGAPAIDFFDDFFDDMDDDIPFFHVEVMQEATTRGEGR